VGKRDIEDALQRLDTLTKEEGLVVMARTMQVTHRVDDNVAAIKKVINDVDGDAKATKELVQNVDSNVTTMKEAIHDIDNSLRWTSKLTCTVGKDAKVIERVVRNIDDNVEVTKLGTLR
jgi:methyl-accepting chemotaxis protein